MTEILHGAFRRLLGDRGLLMDEAGHDEKFVFNLGAGPLHVINDPGKVREIVTIARAVYGDGPGEYQELISLYARRDELECPVPQDIVWKVFTPDGPGLNPGRWIRLDVWLADQFLLEYALREHAGDGGD